MTKPKKLTEARALAAPLPTKGKQCYVWCAEQKGFGVRITENGSRAYIVQTRVNGVLVRKVLGRVGTLRFEGPADNPGALDLAKLTISGAKFGTAVDATLGKTTAETFTLGQAWAAYEAAGFPLQGSAANVGEFKRASTIKADGYRWSKHVSKLAGKPVAQITDDVVLKWLDAIPTAGARNNSLRLLLATVSFTKSRKLCKTNVITIKPGRSKCVENYLTVEQLKTYDASAIALSLTSPERLVGFAALRVICKTGCRKSEVLGMRRDLADLDNGKVHLESDKANGDLGRDVLVSPAVIAILRSLPVIAGNPFFFPGKVTGSHLVDVDAHHDDVLKHAGLKEVRVHDLRHSFASAALNTGKVSVPALGKLLGHRDYKSTLRYAHLADAAVRAAANEVADILG